MIDIKKLKPSDIGRPVIYKKGETEEEDGIIHRFQNNSKGVFVNYRNEIKYTYPKDLTFKYTSATTAQEEMEELLEVHEKWDKALEVMSARRDQLMAEFLMGKITDEACQQSGNEIGQLMREAQNFMESLEIQILDIKSKIK